MTIKHIEWTEQPIDNALQLKYPTGQCVVVERAHAIAVIEGTLYAVVKKRASHWQTVYHTYRLLPDGWARVDSSNAWRLHYQLLHEGTTVSLLSCNDSGEPPRRTPCTRCKAKARSAEITA